MNCSVLAESDPCSGNINMNNCVYVSKSNFESMMLTGMIVAVNARFQSLY